MLEIERSLYDCTGTIDMEKLRLKGVATHGVSIYYVYMHICDVISIRVEQLETNVLSQNL